MNRSRRRCHRKQTGCQSGDKKQADNKEQTDFLVVGGMSVLSSGYDSNPVLMDLEMFSQSTNQLIAKCSQGRVGVTTWWEKKEILGEYAGDYVFLPPLKGPVGTEYENVCGVQILDGGAISSGNLSVTNVCGTPKALLKFFDMWYDGEVVMHGG